MRIMNYISCRERVFPLRLAPHFVHNYSSYLYWLKQLLERLGRESTLTVWQNAFQDYNDGYLVQILSAEWEEVAEDSGGDTEGQIAGFLSKLFPSPVEGVLAEEARQIIEKTPPFHQIRRRFPSLNVMRQITTYEALHLFCDGLALVAESLIELHGKQGELIAYDAMLEELAKEQKGTMSVAEFLSGRLSRFSSEPDEADMFTAGLEVEVIRGSEREVVTRVEECEWARYYQERHPGVGYLLACSLDNAAYRSFNESIRLQRTSTLMEGGEFCDFRVYAIRKERDDNG